MRDAAASNGRGWRRGHGKLGIQTLMTLRSRPNLKVLVGGLNVDSIPISFGTSATPWPQSIRRISRCQEQGRPYGIGCWTAAFGRGDHRRLTCGRPACVLPSMGVGDGRRSRDPVSHHPRERSCASSPRSIRRCCPRRPVAHQLCRGCIGSIGLDGNVRATQCDARRGRVPPHQEISWRSMGAGPHGGR